MEEIMGQMKGSITNHTKGWSLSKEGDVYTMKLEGSPLWWAPSENQMMNSNKYCSQLDKLKAHDEKHPELVNRKLKICHQDNIGLHASLMTRQKLFQLG